MRQHKFPLDIIGNMDETQRVRSAYLHVMEAIAISQIQADIMQLVSRQTLEQSLSLHHTITSISHNLSLDQIGALNYYLLDPKVKLILHDSFQSLTIFSFKFGTFKCQLCHILLFFSQSINPGLLFRDILDILVLCFCNQMVKI